MSAPAPPPWWPVVTNVLFRIQFDDVWDAPVVDRVAGELVDRPVSEDGVAADVAALAAAARDTGPLPVDAGTDPARARDFLARLEARLLALRPWPRPRYRPVPVQRLGELSALRTLGTVVAYRLTLQNRLRTLFRPAEVAGRSCEVAALELRTGDLVALIAPSDFRQRQVTLSSPPGRPADAVLADFVQFTGIGEADIVR